MGEAENEALQELVNFFTGFGAIKSLRPKEAMKFCGPDNYSSSEEYISGISLEMACSNTKSWLLTAEVLLEGVSCFPGFTNRDMKRRCRRNTPLLRMPPVFVRCENVPCGWSPTT